MKEKSPAFQLYPGDFLSDERVMLMNDAQVGVYMRLICTCWREGSIPADLELAARLGGRVKATDEEVQFVLECFSVDPDDSTRLKHKRLEEERSRQAEYRLKKSASGKKGARSRWQTDGTAIAPPSSENGSAIVSPMANDGSSSSSSSSSSKEEPPPNPPPRGRGNVRHKRGPKTTRTRTADGWRVDVIG